MTRTCASIFFVVLATTALAHAEAAPPAVSSENRAAAETLFFTARGYMEAGRYAEACQKFSESYRLDPAAGTLLNLAVCHEKIGKIASAWAEFKQAASEAKKAGRADREDLAKQHIDVLEPELPYLRVEVPAAARVPGLEVVRNEVSLLSGSWGIELPVDPGDLEIIVRAPGYKPRTSRISIGKREHKAFTVQGLEKAPIPPPALARDTGWSATRSLGFTMVAVGVGFTGLGGYFGYRALNEKSKSESSCPIVDDEYRCDARGAALTRDAWRDGWIANIGIGVGVASMAVGTYLFIKGGKTTEPESPRHGSVRWSVSAAPTGFSGFLSASF